MLRHHGTLTTSPPLRVTSPSRIRGLMGLVVELLMNWTEPSAKSALNPPGCLLPVPSDGSFMGAIARSAGLLQGTELAASTTRSVLLVPSVTRVGKPRSAAL